MNIDLKPMQTQDWAQLLILTSLPFLSFLNEESYQSFVKHHLNQECIKHHISIFYQDEANLILQADIPEFKAASLQKLESLQQ